MAFAKMMPRRLRAMYRKVRATVLSVGLPRHPDTSQSAADTAASAKLSVIVPIYGSSEIVARCLCSLKRYAGAAEVIIVDDGSPDAETAAVIEAAREGTCWQLIRNPIAQGHSRACEAGGRVATRPYLCLLNSDTVLTPWSWAGSVEALDSDPEVAVTGPSTSHAATPQALFRAHYCRHYWSDQQIIAFAQQHLSTVAPRSWVELPELGGFAFLIRRQLWLEMGGFDANLTDYGNESELCIQIRKRGLRIIWVQNNYIHHLGSQSYGLSDISEPNRRALAARAYIHRKHAINVVA